MGYGAVRYTPQSNQHKLTPQSTQHNWRSVQPNLTSSPPSPSLLCEPLTSLKPVYPSCNPTPSVSFSTDLPSRSASNLPSLGGLLVLTRTGNPSASLADSRSPIYPSEPSFTRRMVSTLPDRRPPTCSLLVIVGPAMRSAWEISSMLERMSCSRIW